MKHIVLRLSILVFNIVAIQVICRKYLEETEIVREESNLARDKRQVEVPPLNYLLENQYYHPFVIKKKNPNRLLTHVAPPQKLSTRQKPHGNHLTRTKKPLSSHLIHPQDTLQRRNPLLLPLRLIQALLRILLLPLRILLAPLILLLNAIRLLLRLIFELLFFFINPLFLANVVGNVARIILMIVAQILRLIFRIRIEHKDDERETRVITEIVENNQVQVEVVDLCPQKHDKPSDSHRRSWNDQMYSEMMDQERVFLQHLAPHLSPRGLINPFDNLDRSWKEEPISWYNTNFRVDSCNIKGYLHHDNQ